MDNDQLELTRRRLEEQVKTKVEADLFRYYRKLGSVIIAVLGLFGIAIGWPTLRGMIESEIRSQIAVQVSDPVDEAKAATEKARRTASEAEKLAKDVLQRLEERQVQLREDIGRVNARYDEVSVNYGSAKTRLNAIHDQISQLEEAIAYFRELAKRDPVGRGEVESLKASIAEVAARAGELALIVGKGGPLGADAGVVDTLQQGLEEVARVQKDALAAIDNATIVNPRGNSTVFVQFAGGRREDIRSVTGSLREEGWTVPGEERIATAAGKREIRYFHETDRQAAALLREDINAALTIAGFAGTQIVEIGGPLRLSKPPAKGILEVWLELPVR